MNSNVSKKIVAIYKYEDENEQLLFEAVRYKPKSFSYRQPDSKGGWIWSLEGVRRIPYRLPELLSNTDTVFIPGGEKDVDLLWESGLVATTNPCGEGNWKPEFSQHLKDRDVVILEDNDEKGKIHGRTIAESLLGVANSIKIVQFPEMPEHGDVSDYLEGYSIVDLLMKVEEVSIYEEQEGDSDMTLNGSASAGEEAPDSMEQALKESRLFDLTKESTIDEKHRALLDLVRLTQGQDSTWLKLAQGEIVDQLNKIGVRSPAQLVKDAFGSAIHIEEKDSSGGLDFDDPEPWDDTVDGLELLEEITGVLEKHVILPDGAKDAVALWILTSWTHDAFEISPLLNINSPTKRCGKTTLLDVISALVPRPLVASNISTAGLFRSIEAFKPTLLIDEADTFLHDNQEIYGVLNAGHRKRGAFVLRVEGDDFSPKQFSVWCPKVFAGIGKRKDTFEDRSIVIAMRRKERGEVVERIRADRLSELNGIKRKAFRWAKDNIEALKLIDPELPESLNDRGQDNWRPLISIAECVGGSWPEKGRQAALLISGEEKQADESTPIMLLSDIKDIFDEVNEDRISTVELLVKLIEMEDRPWPEFKQGWPITPTIVAKILRPFQVGPTTIRFSGSDTKKGYYLPDFEEAFRRYLPDRGGEDVTDVTIPF
jgi:putative DNA primase/helicase